MRLAWCTDVHLDHLDSHPELRRPEKEFVRPLSSEDVDGFLFSGDVTCAGSLPRHLDLLDKVLGRPIHFVLGNHDFWGGDFNGVRGAVSGVAGSSSNLNYLTQLGVVPLTDRTALVGHDGWYDALHGDPEESGVLMNDWLHIGDFSLVSGMVRGRPPWANRVELGAVVAIARKTAWAAAEHVREHATTAAAHHDTVIVLTHVPPWVEAHRHDNKSGGDAMPWYTSKLMGDAIEAVAAANPRVRFEVFCGHTHGQADVQVAHNVFCHVGGAQYGRPGLAGIVTVP